MLALANIIFSVILSGLTLGGLYALMSSGLDLTFGVMNIINFAQADYVMLGMYTTYVLYTWYGLDPFASLLITAPLGLAVGLAVQRLILNRTIGYALFIQTVATFGLSLVFQNSMLMIWGASYKSITFWLTSMSLTIFGGEVGEAAFVGLVASLAALSFLYLMLTHTTTGMALRAASENKDAARLLGIKVSRMHDLALGLSGVLGFIAGTFISTFFYIYPTIGSLFLTRMFVIVVLGGLGNIVGAAVGGLVIGETEVLTSFFIGAQWSQFVSMLIFVIILLLRPKGIFGVKLK